MNPEFKELVEEVSMLQEETIKTFQTPGKKWEWIVMIDGFPAGIVEQEAPTEWKAHVRSGFIDSYTSKNEAINAIKKNYKK